MANSKLNVDGVLLLEQPFVRVPYENYRKIFRTSQRNVEKELGPLQTTSNDLVSKARTGTLTSDEALKSVDGMIGRVESLKRKLSDLNENAGKPTLDVMRERLEHLATIESIQNTTEPEFSRWADTRLDRWLVDWTLRNGKERTAKRIARDKDIQTLVDIDLFSDIKRIEDALARHSCTEALAWCSENKAALRKIKSTLEFELRLQEFIELARQRRNVEAIAYTKKHLVQWQETHFEEIKRASALFAFPPTTTCGPYKRLYDVTRWSNLIRSFRLAIYSLNTLPNEPLLHLTLYAGLASLKLPACFDIHTKNVDCPVCDGESAALSAATNKDVTMTSASTGVTPDDAATYSPQSAITSPSTSTSGSLPLVGSIGSPVSAAQPLGLGKLAEEVPFSHHANSTIVCRITGKIMDEDNMPMAFPKGQVYSLEAMQEMAAKNDNIVTCPRTGETCAFSQLRKVFIS
ncbi:Macrophage erythroblast attacher [Leucoagaricus sp. SymC.cos]|nr:Macrophage erythroblast attacher [Leucoagaricus sp. SymC.cos]